MQPAQKSIQIGKAARNARYVPASRQRGFGLRHGLGQGLIEAHRPFAIAAALGHSIERFLGLFDLLGRRDFGPGLEGRIDDVFAHPDQFAPHGELGQDARIILRVGHGGRGARQAHQIILAADFLQPFVVFHRRAQSQRRHRMTFGPHLLDRFIKTRMKRVVKMFGLQDIGDALQRIIVDQQCAQKRLFDLHVIRELTKSLLLHRYSTLKKRCGC